LWESEGWIQEVFRTSLDAILVFNGNGVIVSTNPAACEMYGYDPGEMEGLSGREIVHPDSHALFERFLRLPENGGRLRAESRDLRKDGTPFDVEVSGSVFQYFGRPHLLAMVRDVTDRKRAESALKESEERFRSLVENANDIIYALSPEGVFTYISPNWQTFMGEPAEAAVGRSFEPYVHPDDVHLCRDFLQTVLRTGETQTSVEYRALHRNGEVTWHMSKGAPLRDDDGKIAGYIGIARDVTERKRMVDALRESEARYRSLTENFPDGALFLFDEEFRYLAANGKAFARAGLTSDEVVGKTVAEVFPEHWNFFRPYHEATLRGEETRYEVEYMGRVYSNQCLPVVDEDGGIRQGIVVTRDITDALRTAAEKERLEDQFHQAQKMESIGRLAGGVAHDFNNLLAPILGYGEMVLEDFSPEDARRASVEAMVQAALRARDLVRQLLAFSRKQVLEVKPVDLNGVLTRFEKLLRRAIREDVAVDIRAAASLPLVEADVGQLEQVIMNLAVNAQDAMAGGGLLTIETAAAELDEADAAPHEDVAPGPFVVLTVSDTGCGMDAETRNLIFEPFFTTKEKEKGTGLGLATVYGIVRQHGGLIRIHSEPEKGATFRVYLPAYQGNERPAPPPPAAAGDLTGTETILLVEDNAGVREMTRAVLERQGYGVFDAENGRAALTLLDRRESPVHLLLIDVVLPDMSGKALFDRISKRYPGLKVIFMSGYDDQVIAPTGVLEEGICLIQKPFSVKLLAAKVREVLDGD
jgi:PAS domain S-box-containing protein